MRYGLDFLVLAALFAPGCASGGKADRSEPPVGTDMTRPVEFDLQGHRGCRGHRPENTISGFIHALELGANTLEMDVCLSKDGKVVVSHEPWIDDKSCSIDAGVDPRRDLHFGLLDYEAIRWYDCGVVHPDFAGQRRMVERKPLLGDVFRRVEGVAPELGVRAPRYSIEIKSRPAWDGVEQPGPEAAVEAVLEVVAASGAAGRVTVQSFDERVLRLMRERAPDVPLAYLVEFAVSFEADIDRLGFRPAIYSPNHRFVTARLVRMAHAAGVQVVPWTVNDEHAMRRLIVAGVDGLITDYPDRGAAVLREVGMR